MSTEQPMEGSPSLSIYLLANRDGIKLAVEPNQYKLPCPVPCEFTD